MRLIAFLEYAAVVIGVVAMIAGQLFALPKAFHLGVFLVGAGMVLGGIEALFTRRMAFRPADDAYENYAGAPAVIVGLMALVIGAGAIASAYLLDMAQWHATVHYLMRRPAPLLAVAGLFPDRHRHPDDPEPPDATDGCGGSWSMRRAQRSES